MHNVATGNNFFAKSGLVCLCLIIKFGLGNIVAYSYPLLQLLGSFC